MYLTTFEQKHWESSLNLAKCHHLKSRSEINEKSVIYTTSVKGKKKSELCYKKK